VGAHLLSNSKGEGRQADGGDVVSGGSEIAARLEIAAPGASATLAVERDAADFLNARQRPEVRRRGIDPDSVRHGRRLGRARHEAVGMSGVGRGEDLLALRAHEGHLPVMHHRRGGPADAAVAMLGVVHMLVIQPSVRWVGVAPVWWRVNCFRDRHGTSTEGATDIAPPWSIVDPEVTVRFRLPCVRSKRMGDR
jgi:hypothetical protein